MILILYFLLVIYIHCIKTIDIAEVEDNAVRSYSESKLLLRGGQEKKMSAPWKIDGPQSDDFMARSDPVLTMRTIINTYMFGNRSESIKMIDKLKKQTMVFKSSSSFLDSKCMRGDLFLNKSRVFMTSTEYMFDWRYSLNVTNDYLQTAVDAFTIFISGTVHDIMVLPPDYVLKSSRTIAMMQIPKEKLAATWTIVKNGRDLKDIPYETLEMYRPLFKHVNAREMAKLNLTDDRILAYIGTHADLNRHQVGVIASSYIKMNPKWTEPRYLNLMNNLLCGVPMIIMRKIKSDVYLQLTHQVFYHIHACDPMQRTFYLAMMTKTEALGKSYSWTAYDVSRLGLLLAEVKGPDLATIPPEALSGISSRVMVKMAPQSLKYFSDVQTQYLNEKPFNIYARKLKAYEDAEKLINKGLTCFPFTLLLLARLFTSLL